MIGPWLGFAEQFALVVAGCLAYALLAPRNTLWAVRTAHIGRFLFGICVVVFGLAHFLALSETAGMVPKWLPPGQRFWALATGTAHLLAGIAILTGILAVLASRLLTAMLTTFGVLVWAPSLFAHPDTHMVWAGDAINLALTGAAWAVADSIRESAKASQILSHRVAKKGREGRQEYWVSWSVRFLSNPILRGVSGLSPPFPASLPGTISHLCDAND
jgi:uncharacterized membrane protein YphA (DoxX/SURF4 family)